MSRVAVRWRTSDAQGDPMKLLFPNGEHAPVELEQGVIRLGSGAANEVLLAAPGIATFHCEIDCRSGTPTLRLAAGGASVIVNGRQLVADVGLKAGDLVLFGKIGARVTALDLPKPAPRSVPVAPAADDEEDGRTRVRMALPRYVLRGVSGTTFGKTYPLYGNMVIGRAAECDLSVPGEEISRRHAQIRILPDGVEVEDLGSANGTFINNKRISKAVAVNGDEIRLDTVRFMVVAPGQEMKAANQKNPTTAPAPQQSSSGGGSALGTFGWVLFGIAIAAGVLAALNWYGVIRL